MSVLKSARMGNITTANTLLLLSTDASIYVREISKLNLNNI